MQNLLIICSLSLLLACTPSKKNGHDHEAHSTPEATDSGNKPLSPRTTAMANVGENHIHIDYGSPSKRGRMIFGGLVGFDQVWATGAHKATFINFGKDVIVNGEPIEAGKYGLFTIPGEKEWTIIISRDWDMHLADDYDQANDIVRIIVPVQKMDETVESLTFEITETDPSQGVITLSWDQTRVSFTVRNK
ncbi:MAG: DUF2911 domain-containing protein [Cyclobacteriaceae bacterium]|nr:DUF2911 domain-containing protein [Cyclobacteriaceae bacterium SS2]